MDPATEMSLQEAAAVQELRTRVQDLLPRFKTDFDKQDMSLLRFIRARELNINKAEEMLRKHMTWRKTNEIDDILDKYIPPHFELDFAVKLCGRDKEGYVVLAADVGNFDFRTAVEAGYARDFVNFVIQWLERVVDVSRQISTPRKVYNQAVVLFDLENFSYRQLASKQVISMILEIVRTFEANYPELLRVVWIVNAPAVFSVLWGLVRPLLTERTTSKIRIFGNNKQKWRPDVVSMVHEDTIPSSYGGANTTCPNFKHGVKYNVHTLVPTFEVPPTNDRKDILVAAGQMHTVEVNAHTGMRIHWQFKTDGYDILFRVDYEDIEDVVLPVKVDSHLCTQKGMINCDKSGRYTLVFDNTYSSWTSKSLAYTVWTS